MPLKPNEIFVRACLKAHFKLNSDSIEVGEDPPDIYLFLNGTTIAVEISTLSFVSFDKKGNLQNRNTHDSFGLRVCEEINAELSADISQELSIYLNLYMPVDNPAKFKKLLLKVLRNFLFSNPKFDIYQTIEINGSVVGVIVSKDYFLPGKRDNKILCFFNDKYSTANILENAKATLSERILNKNHKCSHLNNNILWLALLNDYFLASPDTYRRAFNQLEIKHIFHKILLINSDGSVYNIANKPDHLHT